LCPNGRASSLRASLNTACLLQKTIRSNVDHESPTGGPPAVSNPSIVPASDENVASSIVHTSDANFERDVLKADRPVLLDFWAEWCGPCKMIAPILDEIAKQYKDKIRIAKLNIDENPATPPKFNIRGIPTLILFKNGTVEAQKVGAVTKSQLAAFLDSNL
jgi:thioredoxin 1